MLCLALPAGGCSFSYKLDTMFTKADDGPQDLAPTGSLRPSIPPSRVVATSPAMPAEIDLVYARTAANDVLTRGGKDASQPWENPRTGARGTITPIATAYVSDGVTCRDFLASYVHKGGESWMQGEACRVQQGRWEIRTLKPWSRT